MLFRSSSDAITSLEQEGWDAIRLATRYSFSTPIDVTVNGSPALLMDLSVSGCGLRTSAALKTGAVVRLQLPDEPAPLPCQGQVAWVREEAAGRRVGVQFTQADEAALEVFIIMHAAV